MKKVILVLAYLMLMHWQAYSQNVVVQGTVLDKAYQSGLPGVYVLIKGTVEGTVTDMDGNYKLSVPSSGKQTLVFSYIGYVKQEVEVGAQTEINVQLEEDLVQLGEVIVTAMNIKQNKRDLNFSAQDIKAEEIAESQQQNVITGLQGKIAGVQITSSSGSPGSSSSIIIRGGTSITGGNEPLFVIDGIIMDNGTFQGSGNRAMDINPDDIESISVLKGPTAAALYGMGAGNGVVIITTKSGKKGEVQVRIGTTIAFDKKFKTHEVQTTYGRGIRGVADDETSLMWGPAYTESSQTYNNIDDFFQTGLQQKYDVGISGGNDKSTFLLSLSDNHQTGIVPGEKYNRFNFLLKASTKILDNLTVTASVNNILSKNTRGGSGSMINVFRWPTDDNMAAYLKTDGSKRWLLPHYDEAELYKNRENPYWNINNNLPTYEISRNISQIFFDWDILEPLKLTYRMGMDRSNQYYRNPTVPQSAGSLTNYSGKIYESEKESQQITSTLIASYSKMYNGVWDLYAMAGFNVEMLNVRTISYSGSNFLLPNLISINNVDEYDLPTQSTAKRRRLGVFGDIRLDYKGIASIGITARNDWTSTLHPDRNSFAYPSFSAGFVFTELMGHSIGHILSFGKIRASWAAAGKDAPPESLGVVLEQYPGLGGGYKHDYYAGNPYLKPEKIQAIELGVNLALYQGRFNLDIAYYNQNAINMVITPRVSTASGWVVKTINTGDMENKGIEIVLDSKILTEGELKWDASLNFARNRSKLTSLPSYISRLPVTSGQIINEAKPLALINEPLYAIEGIPYLRNEEGNMVIDENGYPRWGTYAKDEAGDYILNADGTRKVSQENVYLGNREPDFLIGFTNTISYKQFSLSFLFDIRKGGDVINATASHMMSSGTHKLLDTERNKIYTFSGEVETPDGFVSNDQEVVLDYDYFRFNYRAVGENFVEDGSWVKLRYVALTYDMSNIAQKIDMQSLLLTVTARNLFMLSTYSGGDPESDYKGSAVGGAGTVGLDYFNVPTTQGITFSLKATF